MAPYSHLKERKVFSFFFPNRNEFYNLENIYKIFFKKNIIKIRYFEKIFYKIQNVLKAFTFWKLF